MKTTSSSKVLADLARDKGLQALAAEIGVSRQLLAYWLDRGIPAKRLMGVAKLTGIPREKLRPDLYA